MKADLWGTCRPALCCSKLIQNQCSIPVRTSYGSMLMEMTISDLIVSNGKIKRIGRYYLQSETVHTSYRREFLFRNMLFKFRKDGSIPSYY